MQAGSTEIANMWEGNMFLDKQRRASCDAELIFDVTKSIFQAPNPSFLQLPFGVRNLS